MDLIPIFKTRYGRKAASLPIGVEIRYEKEDAEHLVHILMFLKTYEKNTKGTFALVPIVNTNGYDIRIAQLLKSFQKYEPGSREVNGFVSIFFLDEMRPLLEEYLALLEKVKKDADRMFEWDEDHELYPLAAYFEQHMPRFFPKKTSMH